MLLLLAGVSWDVVVVVAEAITILAVLLISLAEVVTVRNADLLKILEER